MKEQVVRLLEQNKGNSISGSEIAKELHITRAAVWKIINNLRAEGYAIEAVTNKGYCLKERSDVISQASIHLDLHTKVLGRQIQVYKTVTSTNTVAKELVQKGEPEGLVIIAEEQTMGRGRRERSFYSPPTSGIYMSMILRPKLEIEDTLFITVAASVAVAKAIKQVSGVQVQIKWVNDLYLDDRKVCGILTEGSVEFESRKLEYAILGIGINVSTSNQVFPEELRGIAGSLAGKGDKSFTRSQLIAEILNQLEACYGKLKDKEILDYYRNHSSVIGQSIKIVGDVEDEIYEAIGIDEEARLMIRDNKNNVKALSSGEIRIRTLKR